MMFQWLWMNTTDTGFVTDDNDEIPNSVSWWVWDVPRATPQFPSWLRQDLAHLPN
jgi:hypothetical protein